MRSEQTGDIMIRQRRIPGILDGGPEQLGLGLGDGDLPERHLFGCEREREGRGDQGHQGEGGHQGHHCGHEAAVKLTDIYLSSFRFK